MSRLLARIMLAVFMLPIASLVYLAVFAVLYESLLRFREERCFIVTGLATGLFVAGYWILIWRGSVRWTRARVFLSVATAAGALAAGAAAGGLLALIEPDLGAFVFGPALICSWLVGTVFVFRETAAERAARIGAGVSGALVCPACGYNMTGLRRTTCPECGAAYTVDELFASQPAREDAEIEARPAA